MVSKLAEKMGAYAETTVHVHIEHLAAGEAVINAQLLRL